MEVPAHQVSVVSVDERVRIDGESWIRVLCSMAVGVRHYLCIE